MSGADPFGDGFPHGTPKRRAYWAAVYKVPPPSAVLVHWAREGEAAGFRAETMSVGATGLLEQVTAWRLIPHDLITHHEAGEVYFDDVNRMLRDLWPTYPPDPVDLAVSSTGVPDL